MGQSWFVWGTSTFSLLLGALLSYIIQTRIIEKNRKFQLVDKSNENKQKIFLDRIDMIEKLVTETFFSFKGILSLCVKFSNDEIEPLIVSDEVASLQNKMQYLTAMVSVLADEELNKRLFAFEGKFVDFNKEINKTFSQDNLSELGKAYGKTQQPFVEIIKQLDLLRIKVLSNSPNKEQSSPIKQA